MVSVEIKTLKQNSRQVLSLDDFTTSDIQAISDSEPPLETKNYDSELSEHDAWFREQIQQALDESNKSDAVFIPHAQVTEEWAVKRTELLKSSAIIPCHSQSS